MTVARLTLVALTILLAGCRPSGEGNGADTGIQSDAPSDVQNDASGAVKENAKSADHAAEHDEPQAASSSGDALQDRAATAGAAAGDTPDSASDATMAADAVEAVVTDLAPLEEAAHDVDAADQAGMSGDLDEASGSGDYPVNTDAASDDSSGTSVEPYADEDKMK